MCVVYVYVDTNMWMWVFITCVHVFQWAPWVVLRKIHNVDIYIVLRMTKYFFNSACKSFKSMVMSRILDATVRRELHWVMLSWVRLWRTSLSVLLTPGSSLDFHGWLNQRPSVINSLLEAPMTHQTWEWLFLTNFSKFSSIISEDTWVQIVYHLFEIHIPSFLDFHPTSHWLIFKSYHNLLLQTASTFSWTVVLQTLKLISFKILQSQLIHEHH